MPTPSVPTRIPEVGPVIAALPVTLSDTDVSEWVVVCERPDVEGDRRYSTNRVQVLVDEQLARAGVYDLTYEQAMDDLLERAGIVPPEDDAVRRPAAATCPSCGVGTVTARFQTEVALPDGSTATPDSDAFIDAECDNEACHHALVQEPGDGRLRRAHVEIDGAEVVLDEADLTAGWIVAVQSIIDNAREG